MSLSYTLYHRSDSETLWNANGVPGGEFGVSLAIGPSSLVVASSGGTLAQRPLLTIYPKAMDSAGGGGFSSTELYTIDPGLPPGSGFGNAMSLSDLDLVVGCSGDLDYTGAVYSYKYNTETSQFEQRQIVRSPGQQAGPAGLPSNGVGSEFADSVFVDTASQTLIASAPNWQAMDGRVFVYSQDALGAWDAASVSTLAGPAGAKSYFGSPIAATDNFLVVSAVRHLQPSGTFGAVWLHSRPDYAKPFAQFQMLSAADAPGVSVYSFGNSLAVSSTTLLVGCGQAGVVLVYTYSLHGASPSCSFAQTLIAPVPANAGYFGYSLTMTDSVAALGYMEKDLLTNTQRSGVYIYARTPSRSFSAQMTISPNIANVGMNLEYLGNFLSIAPDGTLAASNVGNHFTTGNLLLFSPQCPPGGFVSFSQPGGCALCARGTRDSLAGAGTSAAACVACPPGQSSPAGASACSAPAPSIRPSARPSPKPSINSGQRASRLPTPEPSPSTPLSSPTSPLLPSVPGPSFRPTSFPFKIRVFSVSPTTDPSARPTRFTFRPTLRPSTTGTKVGAALATSASQGSSASKGGSVVPIVAGSLGVVMAFIIAFFLYRRYFPHRDSIPKPRGEGGESGGEGGETGAETGGSSEAGAAKKRLTAYEKWVIYEDHVRAKRIQSIFGQDQSPVPEGIVFDGVSASPGREHASSTVSVEMASALRTSRESRGSMGAERISVVLGNMPGGMAGGGSSSSSSISGVGGGGGQRKSFNQLETLFQPPSPQSPPGGGSGNRDSSSRRSSFRLSFGFGSRAPEAESDPSSFQTEGALRLSLQRLSEKAVPPITLEEATQAIRADAEGVTGRSSLTGETINPLMNPSSLAPMPSLRLASAGRGGEGQNRRLSVAGAQKVKNPLFNSQVRRASLNTRLGLAAPTDPCK